jgi:hypothetical protein
VTVFLSRLNVERLAEEFAGFNVSHRSLLPLVVVCEQLLGRLPLGGVNTAFAMKCNTPFLSWLA